MNVEEIMNVCMYQQLSQEVTKNRGQLQALVTLLELNFHNRNWSKRGRAKVHTKTDR